MLRDLFFGGPISLNNLESTSFSLCLNEDEKNEKGSNCPNYSHSINHYTCILLYFYFFGYVFSKLYLGILELQLSLRPVAIVTSSLER